MLVGIAAFFLLLPRFRERWAICNGNDNGNGNCNCNGGAKAGLQARVALGRHGWVGGTRCKYVHVSSCVAIHGNTRSRQPTRAYPLTVSWCATKKPAPDAPLHWLGLLGFVRFVDLLGLLGSLALLGPLGSLGSIDLRNFLRSGTSARVASALSVCSVALRCFASPWPPANCRRRGVCGLAGPLCRMDAAHEPPWMGLRRVPRTRTPHAWPSHLRSSAL